ncbi:sensor histidine kinase [Fulvivirga imtechensis AK7]|uniref:histidine kinase n=1 Tax=Fulvivirga imtechensis AK7 TaxID=1237149 RepID=L8JYM5_9BACT|nr:ATP-binding protein [Fulvivirga imtechensis]ELR73900.1 sensor histidine kinase [Fulvivirga imtechensis AK7]
MLSFKQLTIKNKLIAAILAVTILALLTSSGFYSYYSYYSSRKAILNQMEVTARLISEYAVGPLVFEDKRGGNEIIEKVASIPEISHAYILTKDSTLFAYYKGVNEKEDTLIFHQAGENYFQIKNIIDYQEENFGYVMLLVPKRWVSQMVWKDVSYLVIIFIGTLLVSVFLTQKLQGFISRPIIRLADFAEEIAEHNDYTRSIEHNEKGEVGYLYDRFNHLLTQVRKEEIEQKRINRALKLSKENYQNLFRNSLVGIFRIDIATGRITQANKRTWEIFQVEPVFDQNIFSQFLKVENLWSLLRTLLRHGFIENSEVKLSTKDNSPVWVSVSGRLNAKDNYFEGVIQDITEKKKNYIELQKVNFELDNFVYHASHDLRSPLRTILGLIHISKLEKSKTNIDKILQRVEISVKRMDKLITDLLTFSRNGRIKGQIEEINIRRMIELSIEQIDPTRVEKIRIEIDTKGTAVFKSDPVRVGVVLNNLISNASKYQVEDNPHKYIKIKTDVTEQELALLIEDNGEGIPIDSQAKIFDMFYRASENSEGSGLGLYIVHNVLEKLGGNIYITSEPGKGTSVRVVLPNFANPELLSFISLIEDHS